jgi:AP2 domain.
VKLRNTITVDRLHEVLDYDRATGLFTWRVSLNARAPAGVVAGCVRADGYRTISVDKISYLSHRLAWLHVTGEWPTGEVDHENTVAGDDRWENLRDASRSQNKANVRAPRNNTSGVKGVYWSAKDRRWCAQIKVYGKTHFLGGFKSKEKAGQAYRAEAEKRFGGFARVA